MDPLLSSMYAQTTCVAPILEARDNAPAFAFRKVSSPWMKRSSPRLWQSHRAIELRAIYLIMILK